MKNRNTDRKAEICEYLRKNHSGKSEAVHSDELERLFSMGGRSVRRAVSELRREGRPICSDCCGYYYAEDQQEINDTIGWLNELVSGVMSSRGGLTFAAPEVKEAPCIEITIRFPGKSVRNIG